MKENAFINTKNNSYSITADVEAPQSASGVILAQGGTHAGWSLYVKDSKPKFAYNYLGNVTTISSSQRLPAGRVTVGYDFVYDGGKPGSGGTSTIFINGKKVGTGRIERTIPFIFGAETADVGMDLYTPVTSDYAKGNNKFTGRIDKVTIDLKETNAETDAAKKEVEEKEGEDVLDED
jgi:arylsulfatase